MRRVWRARPTIVTHLKRVHPLVWDQWVTTFIAFRQQGATYKKIMWAFGRLFSWTVIARSLAEAGEDRPPLKKRINTIQPKDFALETTTLWSFPTRGSWAVHDAAYRGNWAPQMPRNLILRYSTPGAWVSDPFVGGGTTAVECLLLGRNFIGIDINPSAVSLSRAKIKHIREALSNAPLFDQELSCDVKLGDARNLSFLESGIIDLVCAHPPYMDIIDYTRRNPADLSAITNPDRFRGLASWDRPEDSFGKETRSETL
jgi:adenine-specific DNA methylase